MSYLTVNPFSESPQTSRRSVYVMFIPWIVKLSTSVSRRTFLMEISLEGALLELNMVIEMVFFKLLKKL